MFKKRTVKTLACIGVAAAALVFWQQKQLQTRLETENQALRQELEDLMTICLTRKKILSLLGNAFFDDILRNAYILHRETIDHVVAGDG